jgi:zinc protease
MTSFSLPIEPVAAGPFTAWLNEDHSLPVVALAWSWPGGAAHDAAGAEGTLALAAALLTEGAGDLDATAFQDALRDRAIELSFSAGRDSFEGSLRCLADALPEAIGLARLAMTAPRFDADAVERVRARAIAAARQTLETPRGQASRAFWAAAFPGHPAGRPAAGTAESLATVSVEAMRAALAAQLRRDGVLVAASGAIRRSDLASALAELFGTLPAGAPEAPPPLPPFTPFGRRIVAVASPQSQVILGQQGIGPTHPDWEAAQLVLRPLGGGGFSSRLMQALRVERGLTYGVHAGLDALFGGGVLTCAFATENARVAEALAVTQRVWAEFAATGPSEEELEEAIAYMTGSLPLQFTDSRRIAATLVAMRRNGRPLDWLERRSERLRAITRERAAAVARALLRPEALATLIAGAPEGM